MARTDKRRAGWCSVHGELAWLFSDGSMECIWALVVETSSGGCEFGPIPEKWLQPPPSTWMTRAQRRALLSR